jgi:(E)-4-hydroxy-3-methylbut-2-enyl-diphosphate synthase
MGCAVNGPGEAAGADLGISLGRGRAHLFKHGKVVGTVPEDEIVDAVLRAIEEFDTNDVADKNRVQEQAELEA